LHGVIFLLYPHQYHPLFKALTKLDLGRFAHTIASLPYGALFVPISTHAMAWDPEVRCASLTQGERNRTPSIFYPSQIFMYTVSMRIIQILAIIIFSTIAFALGACFFISQYPWVDFSVLSHYDHSKATIVLDDNGQEWTRFQLDKREPISLTKIPQHVIQAFLAAEDRNFYQHAGISWKGIIRSVFKNIYYGRKAQGASTITQQLVKLLFFDNKKTFSRKLKEQLLALIIELQFTKDQILETYLNHICFGCGIYGVQAACQRFWGKDVSQITIDEAALLAGIIRAPSRYCPLDNEDQAKQRRNIILHCMKETKYITDTVYQELIQKPVTLTHQESNTIAPHIKIMIREFLEELVGKHALYTEGFIIQTTLNQTMQKHAVTIFKKNINAIRTQYNQQVNGGFVCIETKSGAIKALIGGYDDQSPFNRATQAKRQIGSIFKPLIYTAALEQGARLLDLEIDEPISLSINNQQWEPHNCQKHFDGPMTLAYALIRSNNMIPIKLLLKFGAQRPIELATLSGITEPMHPYPSLALGCIDSTVLEVVGMINIFAHEGYYTKPYFISWIKDISGKKIWNHTPHQISATNQLVSSQICKVLATSINQWKHYYAQKWPLCEMIGKTGTTNQARTCWFAGSTPTYTTALYIGNDDNTPMGSQILAVHTALPTWLEFNASITQPQKQFNYDPRLTKITIDGKSGSLVDEPADHKHTIDILIQQL